MMTEEHVLVVPTELFHQIGYFQGFESDVERYFQPLLESGQTSYQPRGKMEQDPAFKQLIPYVLFRYHDADGTPQVFQYLRGSGQGEARLHSKRSVGVGGHISSDDAVQAEPYLAGMIRELDEEIDWSAAGAPTPTLDTIVGLINDDSNDVGKVHLGVVHLIDVQRPEIKSREKDLCEAGFWSTSQLQEERDRFESWSQIALDHLLSAPSWVKS